MNINDYLYTVLGFYKEFEFLSNFSASPMVIHSPVLKKDVTVETVEHFYQAMKTVNTDQHLSILTAPTAGISKKLGRKCFLRPDWEDIKEDVMMDALVVKFDGTDLGTKLIETGYAYLEETNEWGDTYWGVCNEIGKNRLGILLMELRWGLRFKHNIH